MTYNATSQRQILISMALLSILLCTLNGDISIVKWGSFFSFILCIILASITYTLTLHKQALHYTIRLFGIPIFRKEIIPSDIQMILFKRTGWISKLGIIKLHKGLSIRVSLFKPEKIYDDLIIFCEENTIYYEKTKDYTLIEKTQQVKTNI